MASSAGIFKRKIYDDLLSWKRDYSDRYAVMVEGARRVGKSTVVEEFAKREFKSYILIDLGNASDFVKGLFKRYPNDLDRFFLLLASDYNVNLVEHESVIIFDEVQLYPLAHQMVKYLVKDGRYPVIETGSMVTLKMKTRVLIPSEEITLRMNPMDFEEFQWALGREGSLNLCRDAFERMEALDNGVHKRLMDDFTTYMLVGGMPQAVSELISSNDFIKVEKAKETILDLYRNDVMREDDPILASMYSSLPSQLNRTRKVFSPGVVKKGTKSRTYIRRASWLKESGLVNPCILCTDPDPALDQFEDVSAFKPYLVDTGLLLTMCIRSNMADRQEIYREILAGRLGMNKGMFFENMVAQTLVANGVRLHYYMFEDSGRKYELDFLMADGKRLVPIEVKSGRSGSHPSLDAFMGRNRRRAKVGYVVHSKNLRVEGDVVYLPIYLLWLLGRRPA